MQTLQSQLAQRPPLETIQELEREYKNLDLLLQGTQRENERCMAELERYVLGPTKYLGAYWDHVAPLSAEPRHGRRCSNASSPDLQGRTGRYALGFSLIVRGVLITGWVLTR